MATKSERGRRSGKVGVDREDSAGAHSAEDREPPSAGVDPRRTIEPGSGPAAALILAHSRFAVTLLFVALAFGIALEVLHGFKTAAYLMDPVRKEFWSLAHFHGVGLALLNLVYSSWAGRTGLGVRNRGVLLSLMAGSVLLPVGFLLGGVGHYGSDPGLGIFLAPAGAALVLYAVGATAISLWRR